MASTAGCTHQKVLSRPEARGAGCFPRLPNRHVAGRTRLGPDWPRYPAALTISSLASRRRRRLAASVAGRAQIKRQSLSNDAHELAALGRAWSAIKLLSRCASKLFRFDLIIMNQERANLAPRYQSRTATGSACFPGMTYQVGLAARAPGPLRPLAVSAMTFSSR
jgi:hypothetical protein